MMVLTARRMVLIGIGLLGLTGVYLFQQTNIAELALGIHNSPNADFAVNRFVRLLLNDIFMLLIIHAWFNDKSITRLAVSIQLIDMLILLPIYLFLKLRWEGDVEISSPLLSQFHRLIVNPTLMILLFPAVYFQRMLKKADKNE